MKDKTDTASELSRFDTAMSKLIRVPKAEIDKRLAAERKMKEKRRKAG